MAHANIYIRKENEQAWAAIEDKLDWINKLLEHKTDHIRLKPTVTLISKELDAGLEPLWRDKGRGRL